MSLTHKARTIIDSAANITLTLGIGHNYTEARIEWLDSSDKDRLPTRECWIDSNLLLLGRWVPTHEGGDDPPISVVCRATALAVGAAIKAEIMRSLEGLP